MKNITHRAGAAALLCALALLAGCGGRKGDAGPVAARVDGAEITQQQIDFVLHQQRGLRPEQAEAASRQVLERLIDQQVALKKAEAEGLDKDVRVQQQLEAARREILARAWADKLTEGVAKPTPAEVGQFYADKPALFSQRRIYNLQELMIEARPELVPVLRQKLDSAKNVGEFIEFLKGNDFRFNGTQAVRGAEQLPAGSLDAISRMKDGDTLLQPAPGGVQVIALLGSREQPVTQEQARPAIEQIFTAERKRKLVEEQVKAARAAAKVEYAGKFAEAAASRPASGASVPAAPASR